MVDNSEFIKTLKEILIDVLDIEDVNNFRVTKDSKILDFPEWDSLAHINIITQLETFYGIRFSLNELEDLSTIENIYRSVISKY